MGNDGMKLCKDCKHFKPEVFNIMFFKIINYKNGTCHAPQKTIISLVDGSKIRAPDKCKFCENARKFEDDCGAEGKYWEAK